MRRAPRALAFKISRFLPIPGTVENSIYVGMHFRIWLLLLSLSMLAVDAQASERRYRATMDESSWHLSESSAIMCRLEHHIPRFGMAVFTQEAGRRLRLELRTRRRFQRGINVELRTETANWNYPKKRAVLARYETSGRERAFKISFSEADRTLHALRRGLQPGFLFYDEAPFIASLSTVRFGEAEEAFRRCVRQLHHTHFDDVRLSNIFFDLDHEFASIEQEESAFENMFEYLQVDDNVSEIVVTGHADKTGLACYNEGLSERRAWYVYDLLIAQGIDENMLRVDYFGEEKPLNRGKKEKKQSSNRRVTVELRR